MTDQQTLVERSVRTRRIAKKATSLEMRVRRALHMISG
jgi:G:T-mismatch repair DNA endonuclease (very short patch repair protein)